MFQLTDNLGLTAILPPPKADNMAHTEDSVQVRDMSLCATLRITTTRIRRMRCVHDPMDPETSSPEAN